MLLSRLSESLKRQDWFTVWLEIFAVIFGVLGALQVNNWNEDRIERKEEREYILRLQADIDTSISTSLAAIEYMEKHAARASVVLKSLDSCSLDADDKLDFANGLFQLGKVVPPYMADGTLQEMRSTGKMAVLQSVTLRGALNDLLSGRGYVLSFFGNLLNRVTPHQVYVDGKVRFSEPKGQEVQFQDMQFDMQSICQDQRFYNAVSAGQTLAYDAIYWSRANLMKLNSVMDLIEAEFDRLGIDSAD
jgi:hypothetical protein